MKKLLIGLFAVFGLIATMSVTSANAAPATATVKPGPYEGVFHGTVYASNGSKAPMSLDLTHRGSVVEGTVFLGEGLQVDGGLCGEAAVPSSSVVASGNTSPSNPKNLSAASTFDVSGIPVKVVLDSQVAGDVLKAQAKIDLPWLCGSDPVLTGTLHRA